MIRMKKVLIIITILFAIKGMSQSPVGIYIYKDKLPKKLDSLTINADSTFRFVANYFQPREGEAVTGTWKIEKGQLILYGNDDSERPAFKLSFINDDVIIKFARTRYMKKYVKEKLIKE
jgi:hypothetical protein